MDSLDTCKVLVTDLPHHNPVHTSENQILMIMDWDVSYLE
jgi:hypothetical protein